MTWFRRSSSLAIIEGQHHYNLTEELHFEKRMATANAIAEQIWREQQLVSTRMTWNLSFQAFLAGIFVFAGSSLDGLEKIGVQCVLSLAAFFVAFAALGGIEAAQLQSDRLKRHWANQFCREKLDTPGQSDVSDGPFPQPFSRADGSKRGRRASRGICYILMVMWVLLGAVAVGDVYQRRPSPPTIKFEAFPKAHCSLKSQTAQEFAVLCKA